MSISSSAQEGFTSLSTVRTEHRELQRLYREEGASALVLERIENFIERAKATGAVLDSEQDQGAVQSLIDMWAGVLYKAGREVPDPTLCPFDPSLAPELPESAVPYVGLDPFSEKDKDLFFGRQALVQKIIGRLKSENFVAVIGPSGSGKSSVILAGVVPRITAGALSGNGSAGAVQALPRMVPGSNPLRNLARAFQPGDEGQDWIEQQVKAFLKDPSHLRKLARKGASETTVLVIDQFEELSTLCEDLNARKALEENLAEFIKAPPEEGRNILLLTMRNDFIGAVAQQEEFKGLLEKALEPMTPMSAAELRDAIEKPAERIGLKFEPGVVGALVHDILGEPAALPLLQFTLLKLWEKRQHSYITMAEYRDLGGGREALTRSADRFLQSLIPQERALVERIFLRLVRPAAHGENVASRYRKEGLYDLAARDRVDAALQKLQGARLIRITGEPSALDAEVEVAHEALVRNWGYLVRLLEEERERLTTRQRLEAKADDWVRLGRGRAGLLTDAALAQAEDWLNSPDSRIVGVSSKLEDLVNKSRRAAVMSKRRQLAFIAALVLLTIVASLTAMQAIRQSRAAKSASKNSLWNWRKAEAEKRTVLARDKVLEQRAAQLRQQTLDLGKAETAAEQAAREADQKANLYDAGKIASEAEKAMDGNQAPQAPLLLSLRAAYTLARKGIQLPPEIADPIHRAIAFNAELFETPLGGDVSSVAFSADGTHFVTAGLNQPVRIWNAATGEPLRNVAFTGVSATAFSPDGKYLALASNTKVKLVDANTGADAPASFVAMDPIRKLAFGPDGTTLAAASGNNCVLWELKAPTQPVTFSGHSEQVNSVAFNATGDLLATGSDDGTAKIWDARGGRLLRTIKRLSAPTKIRDVAFNPQGRSLLVVTEDLVATSWPLFPIQFDPLRPITAAAPSTSLYSSYFQPVIGGGFSPDGTRLITVGNDGLVKSWDTSTSHLTDTFALETRSVGPFAFSPDESRLVFVGPGQIAHMLKIDSGEELLTLVGGSSATSASISADGTKVIGLSLPKLVSLSPMEWQQYMTYWDLSQPGQELVRRIPLKGDVFSAAVDANGTVAAMRSATNVVIYRLHEGTKTEITNLPYGYFAPVPGGEKLVTLTPTNLDVWDLQSQMKIASARHLLSKVTGLAISREGTRAAIAGGDGSIQIWNLDSTVPQKIAQTDEAGNVSILAFSPDSKLLATAGTDLSCRIWSSSTLRMVAKPLGGHTALIRTLSFSPDGALLGTGGGDRTIIVWSMRPSISGQPLQSISRLSSDPLAIRFVGPENDLVAAQADGSIRVFATSPARLIRTALMRITNPSGTGICDENEACEALQGSVKFLANGNRLGRSPGNATTAQAQFQGAQMKIPAFPVEPAAMAAAEQQRAHAETIRQSIGGRMVQAEYLARAQNIQDAQTAASGLPVTNFAIDINEISSSARKASAADLREAAVFLLQGLDPSDPINTDESLYESLLQRAQTLDPSLLTDPKGAANTLTAWAYTRIASRDVGAGAIQQALEAVRKSREYSNPPPSDTDAGFQNNLCWYGSLKGLASSHEVQNACQKAVDLSGGKVAMYIDSRGLNRALNGDPKGAIADFKIYADSQGIPAQTRQMRNDWIASLERGENPFKDDVLKRLAGLSGVVSATYQ